jgi:hypothetical protein
MDLNLKELRILVNLLGDATTSQNILEQDTEIAILFDKINKYIIANYYHDEEVETIFGKGTEKFLNEVEMEDQDLSDNGDRLYEQRY